MNPSDWAVLGVTVMGLGNVGFAYWVQLKVIDKLGGQVRIVDPEAVQPPVRRDARGQLRDTNGRFVSEGSTVNLSDRRAS